MSADPIPPPHAEDPLLLQLAIDAQQPFLERAWVAAICHAVFVLIGAMVTGALSMIVYAGGVFLAGQSIRRGSSLAAGTLLLSSLFFAVLRTTWDDPLGCVDILLFGPFYLLAVRAANHAEELRRRIRGQRR